tara:strand:+ start:169 stop:375 length:207 start_codon:yes stop_codon:yes gene_type:complete
MISRWLFWAIPVKYVQRWCIGLLLLLYFIPFVFGIYYTKLGIIVNLIWYDVIFYGWVKVKEATEGDDR